MRAKQKDFLLNGALIPEQYRKGNDQNRQAECNTGDANAGNSSGKRPGRRVTHLAGQKDGDVQNRLLVLKFRYQMAKLTQ